uniref:Uncharacterized protein n=1 Tax=Arundo donax TaxID=35708 RepID=A0A0A9BQL6_ARUDO
MLRTIKQPFGYLHAFLLVDLFLAARSSVLLNNHSATCRLSPPLIIPNHGLPGPIDLT